MYLFPLFATQLLLLDIVYSNADNYLFTYFLIYLHYLLNYITLHYITYLLTYLRTYLLRVLLNYLLTHSMVQSPSWEANWFAASQEIPHISRNPNVHYRTHKRLPPVSILGQTNLVHIPTSHLLEIHPNIIHPSTSRSPQWSNAGNCSDHKHIIRTGVQTCCDLRFSACCNSRSDNGVPFHGQK